MPHSRKHLKLTGDIHPPEVEDELRAGAGEAVEAGGTEAATPVAPGAVGAQARPAPAVRSLVVAMPSRQYVDEARAQVRARPLATAAVAFFAGFAIGVVTRSR